MTTNTEKRYPIKIKARTYFALKKMGLMGETFDDVIQRVMGLHKQELKNAKTTERDKRMASKV